MHIFTAGTFPTLPADPMNRQISPGTTGRQFPGFSVDTHLENLLKAQRVLEDRGCVEGRTHRFLLVARKEGMQ